MNAVLGGIACFGEALIDFLAEPPIDPARPLVFARHAGGAPANVAVGVATLGGTARFVGMLGADMFGDFLLASLQAAGVDTRDVHRTAEAPTALAFVSLDAQGERSFSFYRPPAADLLYTRAQIDAIDFSAIGVLHACSNSLTDAAIADTTLHALHRAREHGAIVSFDMNLRARLWAEGADPSERVWAALEAADLVKLSAEELVWLVEREGSQEAVLRRLWRAHPRWLIVTDGGRTLRWFTRAAEGAQAPITVPVADTTAAGDAFVAGLLTALTEQGVEPAGLEAFAADPSRARPALRFAAACGALAVTRRGAFAAMPTRAEVDALLARTPHA